MEVSLEEVIPELRLKQSWPSPDLNLLSHKMGMKLEWLVSKGSSPSLLELQRQESFPVDAQTLPYLGHFRKNPVTSLDSFLLDVNSVINMRNI